MSSHSFLQSGLGSQVVHHTVLPEHAPFFSKPKKPWHKKIHHISSQSAGIT